MSETKCQESCTRLFRRIDTSVIVPWLKENYGCEVICFAADVGQGNEMDGLEAKAIASGASKLVVHDLREELAEITLPDAAGRGGLRTEISAGTSIARPFDRQAPGGSGS